jgi:hypothetical protein
LLRGESRALDGIRLVMERVVDNANQACLGVNSICEFGQSRPDLTALHHAADLRLKNVAVERIREAQAAGDLAVSLPAEAVADFLVANIAGIRIAARAGADRQHLQSLSRLALRAVV